MLYSGSMVVTRVRLMHIRCTIPRPVMTQLSPPKLVPPETNFFFNVDPGTYF